MKFKALRTNCITKNNEGFSIVEVLIAVAVLAIVFTPVLKSFMVASITNSRAQQIQNATSIGESLMEEVKGQSIQEIQNSGADVKAYNASGVEVPLDSPDLIKYEIKYNGITKTQGATYDAVVTLLTESAEVVSVNELDFPSFSDIDVSKNVVLSWEMNQYDGTALEMLLDNNAAYDANASGHKAPVQIWWLYLNDPATPNHHLLGNYKKTTNLSFENKPDLINKTDVDVNCKVFYENNGASSVDFKPVNYSVYSYSVSKNDIPKPDIYVFYTIMYDDKEVRDRRVEAHNAYSFNATQEVLELDIGDDVLPGQKIYLIVQKDEAADLDGKYTLEYNATDGMKIITKDREGYGGGLITVSVPGVDLNSDGFSINGHPMLVNIPLDTSSSYENVDGNLYLTNKTSTMFDIAVDVRKKGTSDSLASLKSTMKNKEVN